MPYNPGLPMRKVGIFPSLIARKAPNMRHYRYLAPLLSKKMNFLCLSQSFLITLPKVLRQTVLAVV